MKIVQVSTLYPPELHAGGTLACHALALALARRHEVSVFAGSARHGEAPMAEHRYEQDGILVDVVNVTGGYAPVAQNYRNASVSERFGSYLDRVEPDVVHFHSIQALGANILATA